MKINASLPEVPRVGLVEAMRAVIEAIRQQEHPLSISALSRLTGVDRRTVGKVLDILLDLQETLAEGVIETERVGRRFVVWFRERTAQARRAFKNAVHVVRRNTKTGGTFLTSGDEVE